MAKKETGDENTLLMWEAKGQRSDFFELSIVNQISMFYIQGIQKSFPEPTSHWAWPIAAENHTKCHSCQQEREGKIHMGLPKLVEDWKNVLISAATFRDLVWLRYTTFYAYWYYAYANVEWSLLS